MLYSIVETAKANGLILYDYMVKIAMLRIELGRY
jgi:hypothetical protein